MTDWIDHQKQTHPAILIEASSNQARLRSNKKIYLTDDQLADGLHEVIRYIEPYHPVEK